MQLEWYDIPNFEGIYKINLNGEVKNCYRNTLLTLHLNNKGYFTVTLSKNGFGKNYTIHSLLAKIFLPNPYNKPCVDHINGDKTDNNLKNLRWATYKENLNNSNTKPIVKANIQKKWNIDRQFNYKKLCKPVLCVETGIIYPSQMDASRKTGIKHTKICAACRGSHTRAGGFHWKKIENLTQEELIKFNIKNIN